MSNFWNSFKATTLANQNLAKVDSHFGHFKKICWKPGQKPPKTETKADKSRCIRPGDCSICYKKGIFFQLAFLLYFSQDKDKYRTRRCIKKFSFNCGLVCKCAVFFLLFDRMMLKQLILNLFTTFYTKWQGKQGKKNQFDLIVFTFIRMFL